MLNRMRKYLVLLATGGSAFSIMVLPGPTSGCRQNLFSTTLTGVGNGAIAAGVEATIGAGDSALADAFAEAASESLQDSWSTYVNFTLFPVFTAQREVFTQ
jgi:hypothetical protein